MQTTTMTLEGTTTDRSAAVVEDPAAAHENFRRAEDDGASFGRAAADASHTAALHSSRSATVVSSHPSASWAHRSVRDADSSGLVNFPFAFTAFTLLTVGAVAICCGLVVPSAWLTASGFLLTLAGGGLYGWSVCD